MKRNDGKNDRDPELEKLLAVYREVRPEASETDAWKRAIREERESHVARRERPATREPMTVLRLVVRTAIQVGVAASIGFGVGAWYMERRIETDPATVSFSQTEPDATQTLRPDLDLNREVVHVRIR